MKICRICRCSEYHACLTTSGRGCRWSPLDPTLCSCCTGEEERLDESVAGGSLELDRPTADGTPA